MPLKLVTGPANSAKAGEVLGGYRRRLDEEPILVVPAFRDVEHAQREMARHGAVFGANVVRFRRLFDVIARRAGYSGRVASRLQRRVVLQDAIAHASLDRLAASAERPGFAKAAERFVAELERSMVEPAELSRALARWRGPAHAEEIGRVYSAYAAGMERAGVVSEEAFAWRAVEALRANPSRFGPTPVFLYGFDDFTPIELRTVEVLAAAGVDVTLSLPFERGREAFRAVADTFAQLERIATEHVELEARAEWYAPQSRRALHALERSLFEAAPARVPAGPAVKLHAAGGRRGEVELAGAAVLDLLAGGTPAGEVAVVMRDPDAYGTLVDQVFASYGIPFSTERRVELSRTALGRGLLALLRCAGAAPDAAPEDLLAYLRTPGRLTQPGLADALESKVRRAGGRTLPDALAEWDRDKVPLGELDRLQGTRGEKLLEELECAVERLFAAPHARSAHVFAPAERDDPRVFAAVRAAVAGLRELPGAAEIDLARTHALLADERVSLGDPPQPDRVHVCDPLEVRARRFQAVLLLGLQEGEFPRAAASEPFLSDEDRRDLAKCGVALAGREDQLDRERYLFYMCASRAERLLVLSWRTSDEEGDPEPESFFVEDVRDVLELPADPHAARGLSQVTWPLAAAPTRVEWERAATAALPPEPARPPSGLRAQDVLAELGAREAWSAGALETFADCPVKWLVERLLRPDALEPDAEQLVRGRFAHVVLERVFAQLGEAVTRQNLARAESLLIETIRDLQDGFPLSPQKTRVRAAVRKLEFDLLRMLQAEAERESSFEPRWLERDFGLGEEPAADVGIDGVKVRGRIDRVDVSGQWALVRDYKTGSRAWPVARWEEDRRLQVALYMLALRALEPELKLAGGVYQPLAGRDPRPRGLLHEDAAPLLGAGWADNDCLSDADFERALADARASVAEVVGRLRRGEVEPCPATCAWRGGCSYPAICRSEE